jgi:hypothetical protein
MNQDDLRSQLDYAPPDPGWRRKRIQRKLIWTLIGSLVFILAPKVLKQTQVLWWQHQCLQYTAPANQIVYDDGPTLSQRLTEPGVTKSIIKPISTPAAVRPVKCWDQLHKLVDRWASSAPSAVLYLHRGQTRSGAERVIAVTLKFREPEGLWFQCWDLPPATLVKEIKHPHTNDYVFSIPRDEGMKPLQLYAGQPDPNDPSHFTILYNLGGQQGTIDGFLDGSVTLKVRDGPAKHP